MTDRQTFTHKYIPKSMDLFEQEKEAHEKALKLKKEFSETENASIRDFHWYTKFCYDGSERGNVRIVISYRKKLEYETKNVEQLRRELKEAKEKLEELEEAFEEIEDLDEDELGDFDFESKLILEPYVKVKL